MLSFKHHDEKSHKVKVKIETLTVKQRIPHGFYFIYFIVAYATWWPAAYWTDMRHWRASTHLCEALVCGTIICMHYAYFPVIGLSTYCYDPISTPSITIARNLFFRSAYVKNILCVTSNLRQYLLVMSVLVCFSCCEPKALDAKDCALD